MGLDKQYNQLKIGNMYITISLNSAQKVFDKIFAAQVHSSNDGIASSRHPEHQRLIS